MQYSRDKPSPNGLLRGNQTKQKDIKKKRKLEKSEREWVGVRWGEGRGQTGKRSCGRA